MQDLKYHHNVILQSNFESKSEQDLCVGIVTRGLIWHLDLKVQDMNQHHKVLHFQVQMSNWTSCYNPNRTFALWFKLLFSTTLWCWFMSWTFKSRSHNANTRILFALWFKITSQYDIVVILQVLHFQVQMLNWTSCYNPNIQILFVFWIKITLQYDIVGDT